MKILSNSECVQWLSELDLHSRDMPVEPSIAELRSIGPAQWFDLPYSPRFFLAVAHRLAGWVDHSECLLLMTAWPSFSDEEMDIFLSKRTGNGSDQRLIDAPGHVFDADNTQDHEALTDLIHYTMILNWEGFLIYRHKQIVIWLADQVVELISESSTKADEADILFYDLGIAPIGARPVL